MGHVPPGQVPRKGPGTDLPRRQRREAGEDRAQTLSDRRADVGAAGEGIAAWWLKERGYRILAHNVEIAGGEIDILADDGGTRVAIEVRATTGKGDPIDAIGEDKRRHVRRLASVLGAGRVEFVGIGLDRNGVTVHRV